MMDLTAFVSNWSDSGKGLFLESAGPYCQRLFKRLLNEGKTRSLIATNFWQSFAGSISVLRIARELDLDPRQLFAGQKIVVYRPDTERFDLLVLVALLHE